MGEAVAFYQTLGFELSYGGEEAQFTSFRVGPGTSIFQLDTIGSPPRAVWGRVVLWSTTWTRCTHVRSPPGFDPQTSPADALWVSAIPYP